jgi:hypothetical protein
VESFVPHQYTTDREGISDSDLGWSMFRGRAIGES